jgi:hypothetical protein
MIIMVSLDDKTLRSYIVARNNETDELSHLSLWLVREVNTHGISPMDSNAESPPSAGGDESVIP